MTFSSISHNSMPFMLDLVARGLRLRSNEAIHIIWMAQIDFQNLTVRISTVWVRHIEWCALFLIRWFHSQFKTVNVHKVMRISVFGKDSAYPILVSEKNGQRRNGSRHGRNGQYFFYNLIIFIEISYRFDTWTLIESFHVIQIMDELSHDWNRPWKK